MPETIDLLHWSSMTAAINEIKSPNRFLQRALFSREQTLPTETMELSTLVRGREMAPMVKADGEGVLVGGHTATFATVTAPNIRIKMAMTPSELLYKRRPGSVIFNNSGGIQAAINEYMARELQGMADLITNRVEYMCSQLLHDGSIRYSVSDQENFTITFPRDLTDAQWKTFWTTPPSGNFWNDATVTNRKILEDIHAVKRIMTYHHSLNPTLAICGSEAADVLMNQLREDPTFVQSALDTRDVTVGNVNLTSFYDEDGVIPLGRLSGIPFVEYARQATDETGSVVDMIDPKYIHFVHAGPAADHRMYYGAISDNKLLGGRRFQTRRFSKTWEVEDPSAIMMLTTTRPLPVLRRPNSIVSLKVVSG